MAGQNHMDGDGGGPHSVTTPTRTLASPPVAMVDREPVLPRGTVLGRYVVIDRLGAGGMSVVYSAYDPELDRKIAVKLLKSEHWAKDGRERVLREAQAMARLSHPNVVVVHDVGAVGEQLFIAMELVDGQTLRQWLRARERTWREVLEVMIQAGRGLAAAHAAGLVHRDVKPGNILVDERGGRVRARVSDFGVVAPIPSPGAEEPTPPEPPSEPSTSRSSGGESASPLARLLAVAGTPSYMAPEQRRGLADARSDQYGFAVTLFEALFGDLPARSASGGGTDATPAVAAVKRKAPRWVRAIIQRGLDARPEARFPSMDAMCDALAADPARRARRAAVAGGAVLLVAAGVVVTVGMTRQAAPPAPCRGAATQLAGIWDDAQRGRVRAAFGAAGRAHAADSLARVERALDARATAWVAMRTEACEATHVRHEQSEKVLALRNDCLDRRLGEVRALTRVFASADADVVDHAVSATLALPRLDACADAAGLQEAYPLPEDQGVRDRVLAVRARLQDAIALEELGKLKEASEAMAAVVADARALGYPPLLADALDQLGQVQANANDPAAEATLYEALSAAAAARDDRIMTAASAKLIYVLGYQKGRPAEAVAMGKLAVAMAQRAGGDPLVWGEVLYTVGIVEGARGNYEEAHRALTQVLEVYERELDADDTKLANVLNSLANVENAMGRPNDALPRLERALAIWERTIGPGHPDAARAHNNVGEAFVGRRQWAEARPHYEKALAIYQATLGPDDLYVGIVMNNLANLDLEQGAPAPALAACEKVLVIFAAKLGAEHPYLGYPLTCVGMAQVALGRPAEAIAPLERALALRQANAGDAGDLAETELALARALWATGRDRGRAKALATHARESFAAGGARWAARLAEAQAFLSGAER